MRIQERPILASVAVLLAAMSLRAQTHNRTACNCTEKLAKARAGHGQGSEPLDSAGTLQNGGRPLHAGKAPGVVATGQFPPGSGTEAPNGAATRLPSGASNGSQHELGWFERVSRTQSEQPHWITPLVTVTPRLEEEYRFDTFRQTHQDGTVTNVYGGGKGLELIPAERIELILGLPSYITHSSPGVRDGFGDASFLLKYRLLAANENKGDYILTWFFGASAPTATNSNGPGRAIFTPTVAFGKGWGDFDFQTTLGIALPGGAVDRLGTPLTFNTAFQYRVLKKLWPELEVNSTWWPNGERDGKKQVFMTPGIVIGRLPIWKRLGLTVGTGVQIAVTQFRTYDHNWILSVRLPF